MRKWLVLLSVFLTQIVYAGQTGKIYFTGSIVEPPCEIKSQNDVTCYKDGKVFKNNEKVKDEKYSRQEVKIDKNKKLVVISYH